MFCPARARRHQLKDSASIVGAASIRRPKDISGAIENDAVKRLAAVTESAEVVENGFSPTTGRVGELENRTAVEKAALVVASVNITRLIEH